MMNILLVEDDIPSLKNLSEFISELGHHVFESTDGLKALKILKKEKIHLVLSDIRMPHMDGQKLLNEIKKSPKLKDVVVVLITGHGEIKSAVEAMRNGAYDYLQKPMNVKELSIVIDRINEYIILWQEHKQLTEHFDQQVRKATKDIKEEIIVLRKAIAQEVGIADIGIFSDKMKEIIEKAEKLHNNRNIPILIEGETGTGKEVIARFIHYGRNCVTSPFVSINCAAISPALFESELFGYDAGAFTGGNIKGQKGKFELAEGGTLFLDEIGELSSEFQVKLLRILENREYFRVGGIKKITADVRVICATNQNVKDCIAKGTFRKDLFYRLSVGYTKIPPLCERREEIIPFANMFLKQLHIKEKTQFSKISNEAKKILKEYHWPGNVRELKNTLTRICLFLDDTVIRPEHLEFLFYDFSPEHISGSQFRELSIGDYCLPENEFDLNKFVLEIDIKTLLKTKWNKSETARFLGISRKVLNTHIKHLENL